MFYNGMFKTDLNKISSIPVAQTGGGDGSSITYNLHTTTAANEGIVAASNNGYIVDSTNSTANIVLTLPPAPETGDTVTVIDTRGNFATGGTKNVVTETMTFEGSEQTLEFDVKNSEVTIIFVDSAYGWKIIE